MTKKKTLTEHKEYLRETVKLSLWIIADWANKHPENDFVKSIDELTPMVNHTIFNPIALYENPTFEGDDWPLLKQELFNCYKKESDPFRYQDLAFKLIEPHIDGRAEKDLIHINKEIDTDKNSWITYDLSRSEEYLEIHMENTLYPNSFLKDDTYFYSKLKIAVLEAEKNGYKGLWSCTWLNDLPTWQKKMPKQWNESIHNRMYDIQWHLGFWGQFLTARLCFNYTAATKFRETGVVEIPMSIARASIEDFKSFLEI
ncbi:MAG: hypothetical protein HRU38_22060 [Saccharospirillaceae bacterium]|nr:hypothetical protein [Pseudomonadales bacterium]NRB81314.1 hypothetical protein [Saccharospirillaceae bacterium]